MRSGADFDMRHTATLLQPIQRLHGGETSLPTVVVLDIGLPRVNGLEVLERLRVHPRTCTLPVVILTSSDEQRGRLGSYQNGASSCVRKPLQFAEFAETVARLGIHWLATNEPPHH